MDTSTGLWWLYGGGRMGMSTVPAHKTLTQNICKSWHPVVLHIHRLNAWLGNVTTMRISTGIHGDLEVAAFRTSGSSHTWLLIEWTYLPRHEVILYSSLYTIITIVDLESRSWRSTLLNRTALDAIVYKGFHQRLVDIIQFHCGGK